jgi:hypothetical protein
VAEGARLRLVCDGTLTEATSADRASLKLMSPWLRSRMETCFSRDLARSLALMLLELQAELDEFAHQVEQSLDDVPAVVEQSLKAQTLL